MDSWTEPRLWIQIMEDSKLQIVQETAFLLESINKPVVVVAIAGKYKTGKSYIMSRLAGKTAGFALGNNLEAKTKGVWIWCLPHPKIQDQVLVLIDTEGQSDPKKRKKGIKNDNAMFSLAVLLSSTFIFNKMKTIEQDMIDELHFITKLTQTIDNGIRSAEDLSTNRPHFVATIRDFTLPLILNGEKKTPDEYLNNLLFNQGEELSSEDEACCQSIQNGFESHHCFVFSCPVKDEEDLLLLEDNNISEEKLKPKFVKQSKEFCDFIHNQSPTKKLNGKTIDGKVLSMLSEELIRVINLKDIPSINSAAIAVTNSHNQSIFKKALDKYIEKMEELELPTETEQEITDFHHEAIKIANEFLNNNVYFGEIKELEAKFEYKTDKFLKKKIKENFLESTRICQDLLNIEFDIINEKIKNDEYNKRGGHDDFCKDVEKTSLHYYAAPKKGIAACDELKLFDEKCEKESEAIKDAEKIIKRNNLYNKIIQVGITGASVIGLAYGIPPTLPYAVGVRFGLAAITTAVTYFSVKRNQH